MMQPPRPAAWIAALLIVASLGFMPREGSAWDKRITPVIDPINEGDPDEPGKVVVKFPLLMPILGKMVNVGSFRFVVAQSPRNPQVARARTDWNRGSTRR